MYIFNGSYAMTNAGPKMDPWGTPFVNQNLPVWSHCMAFWINSWNCRNGWDSKWFTASMLIWFTWAQLARLKDLFSHASKKEQWCQLMKELPFNRVRDSCFCFVFFSKSENSVIQNEIENVTWNILIIWHSSISLNIAQFILWTLKSFNRSSFLDKWNDTWFSGA